MTKILIYKGRQKYCVFYHAAGSNKYKCFKTIEDACNYACGQREYIDSCAAVVVEWVKRNNHRIQYKGGWVEFCA